MLAEKIAHFTEKPKTYFDLSKPHLIEEENTYIVKVRVCLRPIEYKNFLTDMLVNREYIERASVYCNSQNDRLECVLISKIGSKEGILVVPGEDGHIKMAAISSCKNSVASSTVSEFRKRSYCINHSS